MHRRRFLATLGLVFFTIPLTAAAQRPGKVYRIGFLRIGQPPKSWLEALHQGLRQRGYVERQNIVVEFPAADGTADPLPRLAEGLARSNVDVILAPGAPPALAAKQATTSVPIVVVFVYDPVNSGS